MVMMIMLNWVMEGVQDYLWKGLIHERMMNDDGDDDGDDGYEDGDDDIMVNWVME